MYLDVLVVVRRIGIYRKLCRLRIHLFTGMRGICGRYHVPNIFHQRISEFIVLLFLFLFEFFFCCYPINKYHTFGLCCLPASNLWVLSIRWQLNDYSMAFLWVCVCVCVQLFLSSSLIETASSSSNNNNFILCMNFPRRMPIPRQITIHRTNNNEKLFTQFRN